MESYHRIRSLIVAGITALWLCTGLVRAETGVERRLRVLEQKLEQQQQEIQRLREELRKRSGESATSPAQAAIREGIESYNREKGNFRTYWKDGLRMDSPDKDFKLKLGGRIMNDWGAFTESPTLGSVGDGVEFRRARLYMAGTIYKNFEFKGQYDFAGGKVVLKDAFIGAKGLPGIGHLRIGHLKEPFNLEEQTSSKYITFIERGLPNAFSPGRNVGIRAHNHLFNERVTWGVGLFRDTSSSGNSGLSDGNYSATGRITAVPWIQNEGERLLHLGVAYSYRTPKNGTVRFSEHPEAHLAPKFVDTGAFAADSENLLGLEAALIVGPFSIQGEYMNAFVDRPNNSDPVFSGYYVQGSYFLTGEQRHYKLSSGAFSRVKPKANFLGKEGGLGAWEVALRYSNLDLNDETVTGGEESNVTAGLNWHLNPNIRVMANYVHADVGQVAAGSPFGGLDAFLMRFQIDF